MKLHHVISWKGEISRGVYFLWGIVLFALKYNLDRLIAFSFFDKKWFISDYFIQTDHLALQQLSEDDKLFYLVLLLHSIPFIWAGTLLTLKRLRATSLPGWMVFFFFLPFLNLLFFIILSAIPDKDQADLEKSSWIKRIVPKSPWGSAVFGVGVVVVIALPITLLLVKILGEYGWGLFVGIPFMLGFGSVLLYGLHNPITFAKAILVALLSNVTFGILLLILALEGLLCLMMAFPIMLLVSFIGAILAYAIHKSQNEVAMNVWFIPFLMTPILGFMEHREAYAPPLIELKSEVYINASKQEVWDQLVAFSQIDPPTELLFKAGIAYPTHAEIEGCGVGAVRKCNFSTGPFIEPITLWNEPDILEFSVLDQPPPMIEWSIYKQIKADHIDGYFRSEKGKFELVAISEHETKLVGTTWYEHNIWPGMYWKLWSDTILHRIHLRVLNHIKLKAEA